MREQTYRVEMAVSERHWWFRGRRRILGTLLDTLPLPVRPLILDIGCGTGANAAVLAERGRLVGVDPSGTALASARVAHGLHPVRSDALRLPFADRSFDVVTALDVLEHLDDDVGAAREIHRVLRPGGWAVVFVPALQILWGLQDEVAEHRRRYDERGVNAVLTGGGLQVQRSSYFNFFLFPAILAARLAMRVYRPSIASENELSSPLTDRWLGALFGAESHVLRTGRFPIGVSVMTLAQRPG